MMRIIILTIIILTVNLIHAQQVGFNSIAVTIDGRNAPDPEGVCGRYNGICLIEDEASKSNKEFVVGEFYLDSLDSLKLAFLKSELPLDIIINLFQDNTFILDNPIKLPKTITEFLNINKNNSTINSGQYPVTDNQGYSMLIVNFGPVEINSLPEMEIPIDKIGSKTEKKNESRTLNQD